MNARKRGLFLRFMYDEGSNYTFLVDSHIAFVKEPEMRSIYQEEKHGN